MTSFEHISRGLSCAAFLAAAGLLAAKRQDLDAHVFRLFFGSLLMSALSEFTSCLSSDFHGYLKVLAHLSEVVSLYMTYWAFIEVGLTKPYDLVFRSLKQGQDHLEEAIRLAESATRAKSEFLANMSHEIRTPMTAILGYADILAESIERPEQKEAIHTIKRNSNHLLTLLNDILDLSKIESGKLHIEQLPTSPLAILADVVSLMRVRAEAKGLPLNLVYAGPLPQSIQTDPTRLRQILVNLVGNAIKFTQAGDVKIAVRLAGHDTANPKLQCEVIDKGLGMSPEQLGRLFQPFQQADASTTRKFGGTGLGLAISKRLAETLGGDITVKSELGKGSSFNLTISTGPLEGIVMLDQPAEAVASVAIARKAAAVPQSLQDCRILLAEDGPDNQRLISFVLRKAGAEVHVCENGQKAMEQALATFPGWGRRHDDPKEPFDVILMDMQMPVMDGYEATRRLRQEGYTRPIIALTAHAMKDDMQKCLDAGCDAYLTKPIVREKFLETIARYLSASRTPPESQAANPVLTNSD
jgi:signal transduction histidine kinase/AmiR/NasT family two-component response regulator